MQGRVRFGALLLLCISMPVFAEVEGSQKLSAFAERMLATKSQRIEPWEGFSEIDKVEPVETSVESRDGVLSCVAMQVQEQALRDFETMPLLSRYSQIWPGALLRGGQLSKGKFVSISIPRSKGEVSIRQIDFAQGENNRQTVDTMSFSQVEKARNQILGRKIEKINALSDFKIIPLYSESQLSFELGVDDRFSNSSLESMFKPDDPLKNYVVAYYTQTFYSVSYEPSKDPFDTFKDGVNFKDRDYQIGSRKEGDVNPPLYVSDVAYGKQLFFVAGSQKHSHKEIENALRAVYDQNRGSNVLSDQDLVKSKEILNATSVSYTTMGGNSVSALAPILASGGNDMFAAVLDVIKAEEKVDLQQSKGVPIAFTVKYLLTDDVVSMGFSTQYVKKTCELEKPTPYSFIVEDECEQSSTKVSVTDKKTGKETEVPKDQATAQIFILDDYIPQVDAYHNVRVYEAQLGDERCNKFAFKRTHKVDSKHKARNPGDKLVINFLTDKNEFIAERFVITNSEKQLGKKKRSDVQIKVNRSNGKAQIISFESNLPEEKAP